MSVDVDMEIDVSDECFIKQQWHCTALIYPPPTIGDTAWLIMTCWKLLRIFLPTLPLSKDTNPLTGKSREANEK